MNRFYYFAQCSLLILVLTATDQSFAQGGLGDLGGQGGAPIDGDALTNQIIDQVEAGGGPANTTNTTNQTNNNNGTGTSNPQPTAPTPGVVDNSTFDLEVPVAVDQRNRRGFIGVSLENADEVVLPEGFKFIGPSEAESFTTGGNRGGGAGGRGAGGTSNVSNGVFVNRTTPIRTRMVPNFRSPRLSPVSVSNRFNRRVNSLPSTSNLGRSMNVVMQGRTAVIRGTAQNRDQIMRIASQLRFEPGVSRIVSQVTITQ